MRARETSESETSESERMYDFWPRRRAAALESHTNELYTTAGVERECERGCDRKEHVCDTNYGEKS